MQFAAVPADAQKTKVTKQVGSFSTPDTPVKPPPLKKARLTRVPAFSINPDEIPSASLASSQVTKEAPEEETDDDTTMSQSESDEGFNREFDLAKDEILEIVREEVGPYLSSLPDLEAIIRSEVRNYLIENGKALFHMEYLAAQKADLKKSSKHKVKK